MNEMTGWTGRVLHINLSSGEMTVLTPAEEVYHRFIGGKGLAGECAASARGPMPFTCTR